ncbi:MAG: SpoIIE family protein phosphatase, partial [Clostridia bacterium]|nr:SpoIIE family protein phosphatase [Clostridia bacterium]
EVFTSAMNDVEADVKGKSDLQLLDIAEQIKQDYEDNPTISLTYLAENYNVKEINVVDADNKIKQSTEPKNIDYIMTSNDQSKQFVEELKKENYFVQEYGPIGMDSSIWRKYAAINLANGGFIQVGYDAEQFHKDIEKFVIDVTKNRHVGNNGFVAVCNSEFKLVINNEYANKHISSIGIEPPEEMLNGEDATKLYTADIINLETEYKETYMYVFKFVEGYYIIAAMPEVEATFMRDASIYTAVFMQILIFAALLVFIYILIKKVIINNLKKVNHTLGKITGGDLDVTVDVRANEEFASLSDDINSTVTTLKRYIAEAAARIDKELEYAKQIQLSALPTNYPNNQDYTIFAQMIAAKEVGGDFYDFYKLNENTVAFLVADVSGKGIPAAMFMMTAKTIIKDLAERGLSVNEVLTQANEKLCENNESGMFVTAWMGILDINSGKLQFANAGHNPPLLKRANGTFEYLKTRAGLVLAGMEGIKYRSNEITLCAGDRLFLYTDGVTEATNTENQLYGEERLLEFMNKSLNLEATAVLPMLKANIDEFVGKAPQFDDITMLTFDYKHKKGDEEMSTKVFPARLEALSDVLAFIEQKLEDWQCPLKLQMAICVAIEEIFVNVAKYAYGNSDGEVEFNLCFDSESRNVTFQMIDSGVKFDPLQKPDPDITLSAEDRDIGGLGIFITKKTMDSISYAYKDGKNILTMIKKI